MMKKYFSYEFKKNLILLLVLTVIASVITLIVTATSNFAPYRLCQWCCRRYIRYFSSSRIALPMIMFAVMCFIVPIIMFSFKMNSRQVDSLYSMSIRREKIYLVKSFVGLISVYVAYTIAFWAMVITTAFMPNAFYFSGFVVAYFLSLPIGLILFGFNAFVFSRANRIIDGVIFVLIYSVILVIFMLSFHEIVFALARNRNNFLNWHNSPLNMERWLVYSPLIFLISRQGNMVTWARASMPENLWVMYLFWALIGAAAWVGLILLPKIEKSENAERISNSRFGYVVLIPLSIVVSLLASGMVGIGVRFIWLAITAIVEAVMYIIYRRSFKWQAVDVISYFSALTLGFILSFVVYGILW